MSAEELEARNARLGACVEFIGLMTRSFSSLNLTGRAEISDTLSALTGSFLDCRVRFALLVERDSGALSLAASEGVADEAALASAPARRLWAAVMDAKLPCALEGEALLARWPEPPEALRGGIACVAIDLHGRSIGVLAVADKRSREPFHDEELSFLSVAAGLGSMAIANADAYDELDAQRHLAELRAEQAAAETRDKHAALVELDNKLAVIEEQRRQIAELSTPILQLRAGVLVLPVIGIVDPDRGERMQARLLEEIALRRASFVIVDLTGVELVDTQGADQLLEMARAARLLGATCIVSGIRPAVAQTLVSLGAELSALSIAATLGDALELCVKRVVKRP